MAFILPPSRPVRAVGPGAATGSLIADRVTGRAGVVPR
jgi:hypothetical protein